MGNTCVRCARPIQPLTERALCSACGVRLRALLAGRPGVRRAQLEHHLSLPLTLQLVGTMAVLGGLIRLIAGAPAVESSTPSGVWQVFAEQAFIAPIGIAADAAGNLYVVDAGAHR